MPTITRKELVTLLSQGSGCSKALAAQVVDDLFVAMRPAVLCCGRIEVRGFGVFQVKGYPSQARHGASHVDLAAARIGV